MKVPPEVQARRTAEYDAARSRYEIDRLIAKHGAEDAERECQQSREAVELRELRQRVTKLEHNLTVVVQKISRGIAATNANLKDQAKIDDSFNERLKKLEERPSGLAWKGVWSSEIGYGGSALVTKDGGLWVATEPTSPGEKPGAGGPWRLITKSDETLIRRAVRDELRKQPGVA